MPIIDMNFQNIAKEIDAGFRSFFGDGECPHTIKRLETPESCVEDFADEMKSNLNEYIDLKAEMYKKLICK